MKSNGDLITRKSWADLCRVIAIFGVIVIHACGIKLYSFGEISEFDWLQANFLDSLVRCSVPLFVMLSGALLLNVDGRLIVPVQVFKRIIVVIIPLFFWNIIYLLYVAHFTGQDIDWLSMLMQPPMYHLWFVYMIIGVYLLLPVLQSTFFIICKNRGIRWYLFIVWIIITCVPIYQPIPLLSLLQHASLLGYGGYFLIGAFVVFSRDKRRSVFLWSTIYIISVIATFVLTWSLSVYENSLIEKAFLYFSPNVLIASIAAFVVLIEVRIKEVYARVLYWISDRSFLVFFMHVVVLERVQKFIATLVLNMPTLIEIVVVSIITYIICLVIASVLRIFPKSKVVLG